MRAHKRRRAAGFTYVGLIVFVAILSLAGAAALRADALLRRAAAEQELLEAGAAFIAALDSYAAVTPKGQRPQPSALLELLADRRSPVVRRHLRKIPLDPVTGQLDWGVIYSSDNAGIIGVHSLSQAKPFKRANFEAPFLNFENKERLSDWEFVETAQRAVRPPEQRLSRER